MNTRTFIGSLITIPFAIKETTINYQDVTYPYVICVYSMEEDLTEHYYKIKTKDGMDWIESWHKKPYWSIRKLHPDEGCPVGPKRMYSQDALDFEYIRSYSFQHNNFNFI